MLLGNEQCGMILFKDHVFIGGHKCHYGLGGQGWNPKIIIAFKIAFLDIAGKIALLGGLRLWVGGEGGVRAA